MLSIFRFKFIGIVKPFKSLRLHTFLKAISREIDSTTGQIGLDPGERLSVLSQDHFAFDEDLVIHAVMKGHSQLWEK
jgi:ATPase subunit of ABC transporter with duplicated ATPase domains